MGRHTRRLWVHAGRAKTGSTAIQQSLYSHLDHPNFAYLDIGKPNLSNLINKIFRSNRRPNESSQTAVDRKQGKKRIDRAIASTTKNNIILSAETISLLEEQDFIDFLDYFRQHFDEITFLTYFRPPKSDMESAFCEKLKHGASSSVTPIEFKHKQRFEMFERHLGKSNLRYYRYRLTDFPNKSVVSHFCNELGIAPPPSRSFSANPRLSLPAIQLLYIYRTQFPVSAPTDKALIKVLQELDGPALRYHSSLFQRCFLDPFDSFTWLERRTDLSFYEDIEADDAIGIKDDADLFSIDDETVEWLTGKLNSTLLESAALSEQPVILAQELRELSISLANSDT